MALAEILASLGHIAEGVGTAYEVHRLAGRLGVDMPITAVICRVLDSGLAPAEAVGQLMERDPRPEF